MINSDLGAYNYSSLGSSSSSFASSNFSLDADNPEQAILYFEQGFTSIFNNFLTNEESSDSLDSLTGGTGTSDGYDPFSASYDYYSQMLKLQTEQYGSSTSSTSLELLNKSANLIDKEAIYSENGQRLTGVIESVVNDGGLISFRIDGDLIAMDQLLEIKGGDA